MVELQGPIWQDPYKSRELDGIPRANCNGGLSSICSICGRMQVRKEGDRQFSHCSLGVFGEMGGHNRIYHPDEFIPTHKFKGRARMPGARA